MEHGYVIGPVERHAGMAGVRTQAPVKGPEAEAQRTIWFEVNAEDAASLSLECDAFGPVSWTREGHGPALASVAHALSAGISVAYVGSTNAYRTLVPWGSHPLVDHLWSSSRLEFVHVGADRSRMEKVREVARERPAWLSFVRVCGSPIVSPAPNCGQCEKCARTALCAFAVGALDLIAPSYRVDVTRNLLDLLPFVYMTDPGVLAIYDEVLRELQRRPGERRVAARLERQLRYLRPGRLRAAVRSLDQTYLGGILDRTHTRLRQLTRRR